VAIIRGRKKNRFSGHGAAFGRGVQVHVSPLAALLIGVLLCVERGKPFASLLSAVAAHEAGHLLLLKLYGRRICSLRVTLTGLEIRYAGTLERSEAVACLLAGPVCGVVYAVAATAGHAPFWYRSALQSYILSAFNLLPILPLDGGRLVAALADERFAAAVSRRMAALLFLMSLLVSAVRFSPGLLLMSLWLLFYGIRCSGY